jgi:uncharacterized protein (UPF0303 family)
MKAGDVVDRIAAQEARLVFERFDEEAALALGLDIKARVAAMGKSAVIDVRLWDRRLFWFAMAGTTSDNETWVERKVSAVRRFHKSTYRIQHERAGAKLLPETHGPEAVGSCVFAGGGFPLNVRGIGCVGAVTVSGLPEREDHAVAVAAICAAIGVDPAGVALPPV